jgi:hypothetical protein
MAKDPSRSNPALTASQPPRTLGDSGLSLWKPHHVRVPD